MKTIFRHTLLNTFLLLICFAAHASRFSYVYIQGDKETPFYVKLEDDMLPRYGKNYCIIPQLAPGTIHIKILFQQNAYPVQSFTVQVPENGYRGFLLMRKDDEFSLYDIHQQFYLRAGNAAQDDKAPAPNQQSAYIPTTPAVVNEPITPPDEVTPPVEEISNETLAKELNNQPATPPATEEPVPVKKEVVGPEFIDIELNNNQSSNAANSIATGNSKEVANSKCPKAINSELFQAIQKKADDKGEKGRLKYLLTKAEENCFNTNQVRILAKALPNDPEKYTFLKKVYPKVTDPSKFPLLEALLSTQEWKTYFKLILQ